MLVVAAPSLLVDGRLTGPGAVVVADGVIVDVLETDGSPLAAAHDVELVQLTSGVLTAGMVDAQINGGYGVDLFSATPEEWALVARRLPETGVTAFVPTYTTAPVADLVTALERAAAARQTSASGPPAARILGVHLEGPFLSPSYAGAHDATLMIDPTPDLVDQLVAAGDHVLRVVTLAPERLGALDAITRLVAAGVVVSLGHTAADSAQTRAAADAGARMVTHLFNAQTPLGHREPGVAGHALVDERLTLGVIADLHHLDADVLRLVFRAAGERVALVTGAIAAAGMPPGAFLLGGRPVRVGTAGAVPRLMDGTIAGSSLSLDAAVRGVIGLGIAPAVALHSATAVPASVLGRPELGRVAPGAAADLVWWDESYVPRRVWVGGVPAGWAQAA